MEPWIKREWKSVIYCDVPPKAGDIIAFECLTKKCGKNIQYLKFLQEIDGKGCIKIQGRKGKWKEKGKTVHSFDSTDYGRLCPGEFKILGVFQSQS